MSNIQPDFSANWYQTLFERSADAIFVMQGNRFVECNEAVCRMFGADSKDAVLQLEPWQLSCENQFDGTPSKVKQEEYLAAARDSGSVRFDWLHKRIDGTPFPAEVVLTVVSEGDAEYIHANLRDISERKLLEDELRHAQKLEAIGKLVGGIAHDFNNQLLPIIGYSELLGAQLEDDPKLHGYVDRINRSATHSADLIRRLMAFGRRETAPTEVAELNHVASELITMLQNLLGEDVNLVWRPVPEPLHVRLCAADLEQILLNLISNAREAISNRGTIELSFTTGEIGQVPCAVIEVKDDGCGMDPLTAARVFEPFFTTKPIGKGTGLGLASVHNLVTQAGGQVSVDSKLGAGTTFQVLLPLRAAEMLDAASASAAKHTGAGLSGLRVLIVEDDSAAGAIVLNVLKEAGCDTRLVGSGREAVGLSVDGSFDLLIADVVMPDMSGPELITALAERECTMPVVLMSGHTDNRLEAFGIYAPTEGLLRKPFTPGQLLEHVSQSIHSATHT